jgi:hypothetical protein
MYMSTDTHTVTLTHANKTAETKKGGNDVVGGSDACIIKFNFYTHIHFNMISY